MKKSENVWWKKKEKRMLVLFALLALCGLLLLLFGDKLQSTKEKETDAAALENADQYRRELELTAASLCVSVEGVESARVSLTLEGGIRYQYAKNGADGGSSYVISGGDALFLGYMYPSVTGCVVVYTGKAGDETDLALSRLLSSYLNLPVSKIYVSGKS